MRRKTGKKFLAAFLTAACLMITSLSFPTEAQAAAVERNVSVDKSDDTITIGNGYISREFSTAGNKLSTVKITNRRTDGGNTVFTPASGSEEFKIRVAKIVPSIDRSIWTAWADSYQNESGKSDGNASNLIDGDLSSVWHTKYDDKGTDGKGNTEFPYNVIFNLGESTTFQCFSYTPRQDSVDINGNLKGYELYYSTSESELDVNSGEWKLLKSGEFTYSNGVNPIYVNLDTPCTATQLKLKATSAKNGKAFGGGAEFNLHKQQVGAAFADEEREFPSSALTLKGSPVVENTAATINDVQKTGKKITFEFAPYTFRDVEYTISEVIVMYDGDHFMRKYMEISVPEDQKADAVLDYIDLESLVTNNSDATWTIPTDAGGVVQMERFRANLGQPIYIQGMFFGCEFPAADNEIVNNTGYLRYYTGKSFIRLEQDNQLTQDGKYVTWQTVAGAARSTETEVIQADFFEYIKSIATPSEFRIQYNSWFDNMMLISDEMILKSFVEMDRELNQVEVRPLDSYVVDDGWVNYNNTSVVDAARAGTTLNQSGFWEFNSKFPEGLKPSSDLVHNFGSNFGVWVGPRGGYNFYGSLADILTKSGKGSKAGGSIDVADRTYVENFTKMATDWMKEYGVNYWKWDGFADNAQYNAFPAADGVPGYANRHMTGGYEHMYHVTDLWEAWIDLMEEVRQCEKENNIKNLWISLTCYTNPSPWYLQWANSVWIQCTHDQNDAGSSSNKMDRQMTYRDAVYYDFLKNHDFQFPLSNIYNHDPIYGVEGTGMNINTATDEQFKNYLYMQSTRGSAFWELYFSDSIMTEGKYEVTGEFLEWAENNYHMLRNSKMFGASPNTGTVLSGSSNGTQNAYGYACFDETDGIISFRNPATTPKTIEVTFDRTIGVPEDAGTLNYHIEHSHNLSANTPTTGKLTYGQTLTYTLEPDEVRILRVSKEGDTTAPEIVRIYNDGANEITVKFNEKVTGETFKVNGVEAEKVEASPDAITFRLTVANGALTNKSTVTVTAEDICDLSGNELQNKTASFTYRKNNAFLNKAGLFANAETVVAAENSLVGYNGFSVSVEVYTESTGTILAQGNEYAVGINEDGTAYFTLNGATAVAKEVSVNDGNQHTITGVKENNGMLKIYIDGQLKGAGYKKENRYYKVQAADIVIGNNDFYGVVNAKIGDAAMGYNVVEDEFGDDPEPSTKELNWASGKPVAAKWASDGSDAECNKGMRPASQAVDGTKSLSNYGEFGGDQKNESSYLEVDLGEVRNVSKINLYRYWDAGREYKGTVIALSETADFTEKTIVYNSDKENFHKLGAGTDETYTESADGKTISVENVNARYVRVYMHGSGSGNTNHVVELEVLGTEAGSEADYTVVDAVIEAAEALDEADYKDLSAVTAAVDEAKAAKEAGTSEQAELKKMAEKIIKAMAELERTAKRELGDELRKAESRDKEGYTEESIAEYDKIVSDAKAVLKNPSSTEKELQAALVQIKAAKEVLKNLVQEPELTEAAKNNLKNMISKAEEYTDASKYTETSWKALQDALKDAKDAWAKTEGTKDEFDSAREALEKAISGMQPMLQQPTPQKISEGQIYTVGDYKYIITSLSQHTAGVVGTVNAKLKKAAIGDTVMIEKQNFNITSIQASAFKGNKTITNAVIGKNVAVIGSSAFEKCGSLKKVTVKGNALTTVGKKAFAKCKKLKKVIIKSKKLKKVPKNAFKGIDKKAVVKIPKKK